MIFEVLKRSGFPLAFFVVSSTFRKVILVKQKNFQLQLPEKSSGHCVDVIVADRGHGGNPKLESWDVDIMTSIDQLCKN